MILGALNDGRGCVGELMRTGVRLTAFIAALISIAICAPANAARGAVDRSARYVKAASWVNGSRYGPAYVELMINGEDAAVRVRSAAKADPEIYILSSPSDVLSLLADKHMQFLWQPLESWAGPGLVPFRDRTIARLQVAAAAGNPKYSPSTTAESTVRSNTRALLQLAYFLAKVGREDEAEQLLRRRLATMKFKGGESWQGIEWFSVAAGIGRSRGWRNDYDGAAAQYQFMERAMGDSPYAVNATINRASLLALGGRYGEALSAIDAAFARYIADSRGAKVPGSERQFAWIRACALAGLGRHTEAEEAFRPLNVERERNTQGFVIEPDSDLQFRARMCMKQERAMIELLSGDLRDDLFTDSVLLTLQPGFQPRRDQALWAAVRSDPGLMTLARERLRELPPEMIPALNGWRDEKLSAPN